MKGIKKHLPVLLLLVVSGLFVFIFYGKAFTHSNNYLFTSKGDGLKNYFTYCYHIQHDSSYINFEGMNYPYGENHLYTDCHPLFANIVKCLSFNSNFFQSHKVGLLNFIMIISIFLTFIVYYYVLLEYNLNKWLSIAFSFSIVVLAPQIYRLMGHLSLSYSLAIPLSWLLTVRCLKQKKTIINGIFLFLNLLLWMFIHAYLGIIVLSFLLSLLILKIITDKNRRKFYFNYLFLFMVLILPVIIFYLFSQLTDNHINRTNNPSGFFLYNAEPDDVFIPHHPPLRPVLDKLTHNIIKLEWEAWGYVGFFTTILFLVLLALFLTRVIKRKKVNGLSFLLKNKDLNLTLIAASVVLLFAFGFPFKQIPGLLDYFPALKQFRATGRFTWPFFFVATLFSAHTLNELHYSIKENNRKYMIWALIAIFCTVNVIESYPYHKEVSKAIIRSENVFRKELLPGYYQDALKNIHEEEYQAIIALPFYHVGSESFGRKPDDKAAEASMILSYYTGIPLVCSQLARTSIDESKKIVQLISPDFYKKPIVNDFPEDKPLLVVKTNSEISGYEADLLKKCQLEYSNNDLSLYSLSLKSLFKSSAPEMYNDFLARKEALVEKDGFLVSDSLAFLYYNDFEKINSPVSYRGSGSFQSVKKGKNVFAEFAPYTFNPDKEYEISIWMHNGEQDALNLWFRFIIEEYDEANGVWYSTTCFPEFSETIDGNWSLIEGSFKINNPASGLYIISIGKENSKAGLYADDLLIREKGTDVYNVSNNTLFYNNHKIILKENK